MRPVILNTIFLCISFFTFSQLSFVEEASLHGIDASCGPTVFGNGVSFVDYNNDGWDDITIATGIGMNVRFFKNNNGMFVEELLNIPGVYYRTKQINWVDFDNDGDKDLYVTSDTDGNRLYENDGDMNFLDITINAGLSTANEFTYGASWGDIDNDGYLDLYICNRDITFTNKNKLFLNNGDGTFTDISSDAEVGIAALSLCAAFFDYNNDGYQDIYVSNDKDYTTNYLFKNNGDGTFDDVSQLSQSDLSIDAMSVTVGDYNNDGWFDIYITNLPEGNSFLKNNGNGTFTDIAASSGTLFNSIGWGAVFLDAENDTDLDLYVSGSADGSIPGFLSAAFYENMGNDSFTIPSGAGFIGDNGESYSNAIGDINNDGLAEIVVGNGANEDLYLWNNKTTTSNNWLKVKLEGTESNADGIGSTIEISLNGNKQFRYTLNGEGYLSQNSNTEFFGLGDHSVIDYVKVTWLSGIEDVFYNIAANQTLSITEGSNTLSTENFEVPQLHISPNPFSDAININSSTPFDHYQIFDVFGKLVRESSLATNNKIVNLSSLKSGIYFLKLVATHGLIVRKLIKK
ncbi:MAG: VCBS repeat-containing protein [Bacteroidia bacterium]|nr:VCBS repeat-containing protein [Bacteroidia bacterium]